jgi:DNA-binding transcriptional MerR regulator
MKTNLVTTKQIAKEYDKPVSAVRRWARMRIIPSIQVGWRTRLFDPEAVRRALLKKSVRELD